MNAPPIIGAVDISAPAPSARDCARWLAVTSGAPLELVYVFDRGGLAALPRMDPGLRKELYDLQEDVVLARGIERLAARSRRPRPASGRARRSPKDCRLPRFVSWPQSAGQGSSSRGRPREKGSSTCCRAAWPDSSPRTRHAQ
jgi:nucleotide-binding universal stress UspA family protein